MDDPRKCTPAPAAATGDDTAGDDRRRVGRIIHDERGTAILEWQPIPLEHSGRFQRITLSVEPGKPRDRLRMDVPYRSGQGYDPYQRVGTPGTHRAPERPKRRDLRKLGEWIKLKREIEERKAREKGED